ncbi:MAG TPA: MBL fold metallo-hydrolase [Tepidisphaeraceae bacterium]|nr:MBL fold metallo-hydrolase [Tepidisphaeraceae bacterium]
MKVLMNTGGIAGTNAYLIADEQTKQAVLFDAPDHTVGPMLDEAQKNGWNVVGLWLTHGHFDHLADHKVVTDRFPHARVLMHKLDEDKLINPRSGIFQLPFIIPPRSADAYVEDGQKLKLGNLDVEVIHTPGHASGHVMYHFPQQKLLVGGDLIIAGSVGRTDLPDSSHAQLIASIKKIMQLPGDTQLLPGHGSPSTLDDERMSNDFVREILEVE